MPLVLIMHLSFEKNNSSDSRHSPRESNIGIHINYRPSETLHDPVGFWEIDIIGIISFE